MRPEMVTSYIRDLLETVTGERPVPDQDGDLPVRVGGALFYVRVVNPTDAIVQVFSVAVAGVPATLGLMAKINDINSSIGFARAFHVQEQVLIESEIWGVDVNLANLQHACSNIARATDTFGPPLAAEFGGQLAFQTSQTEDYRAGPLTASPVGPYL